MNHLRYFFVNQSSRTVGIVFAFNSLMFGSWVTRIPSVKAALDLSEAELGLALLGAPIGALCIMPFAGWVISKLQLGRTVVLSGSVHALSLPLLALADSFWQLVGALVFFGFTNSIMDISMNAAAATTERKMKRPIMSTCHGMWSLGAMLGSGLGSIVVGLEVPTLWHLLGASMLVVCGMLLLSPILLRVKEEINHSDKVFALPNGSLLLLAAIAFCIMVSEGGVADWSAVYMKETLMADAFLTGLAYASFSLLMTIGRMAGDSIIPKIGRKAVVFSGGILASVGLGVSLFFSSPLAAIIGFALAGLGYSCVVPVLFISAANEPGYSAGTGIASVTTIGYAGFLVGPPLIGFVAEGYGLNVGLGFIVVCSTLASLLSLAAKFR